ERLRKGVREAGKRRYSGLESPIYLPPRRIAYVPTGQCLAATSPVVYSMTSPPHPAGFAVPSIGRLALAVAGCALVLPTEARPQARPPVAVRGIAYDGIRKQPLRDAVITLSGEHRQTTTDSKGRFQFDSVAPGVYTF